MNSVWITDSSKTSVLAITKSATNTQALEGLSCHDYDVVIQKTLEPLMSDGWSGKYPLSLIIIADDIPVENVFSEIKSLREKIEYQRIPVIVVCTDENRQYECEILACGTSQVIGSKTVYKDVTKKNILEMIKNAKHADVLEQIIQHQIDAVRTLDNAEFVFRTRNDASNIAALVSKNMPEPTLAYTGLLELLLNAVEHGLCGVGSQQKSDLINAGQFEQEIDRLERSADNQNKQATLCISKTQTGYTFVITDDGDGFDVDALNEAGAGSTQHKNGRGVMMATHCFETLEYSKGGRCVTVSILFKA